MSSNMNPLHMKSNHILSLDAMRRIKRMKIMTKTTTEIKSHNMKIRNNYQS